MTQLDKRINISALRFMPYSILIKAVVGVCIIINLLIALYGAFGPAKDVQSTQTMYEIFSVVVVIADVVGIHCLCGLLNLSRWAKPALIFMVLTVFFVCAGILADAFRFYKIAENEAQCVFVANLIHYGFEIITELTYALAILMIMKTFGEACINRAKRLNGLGIAYFAIVLASVVSNILFTVDIFSRVTYETTVEFLLCTTFVSTLTEAIMFAALRTTSACIWQDSRRR